METIALPPAQTGSSTAAPPVSAARLSPEDLRQYSPPQQKFLINMLGERLRRQPPPTPAEILGIRELASLWGEPGTA